MLVTVDYKIRIPEFDLPPEVVDQIIDALSISNIEKRKAMEQHVWGWERMPDRIYLWEFVDGHLVMPRGFLPNLLAGLEASGLDYEIDEQRAFEQFDDMPGKAIELRPWQKPAVRAIKLFAQGIWKAPAASGKTVAVLEAIRQLKIPSIVLVNTKDILLQWRERARDFLGEDFPVGLIGDGIFDVSEYLTIATVQTLHSRFERLEEAGFFDEFSLVCLDECHHATAETYNRLVNRFSAKYRIGVSATPDKTGDFALATAVLGPVFHETKRSDVDVLVQPEVFKVTTSLSFRYRGRKGRLPSNYPELLNRLTTDSDRNSLIVNTLKLHDDRHALVVSKRLEHLDALNDLLVAEGYSNPIYTLTGREDSATRRGIASLAEITPCVILSTLADEALDIPRLDALFLVYPQRNPGLIEQQVGRICRSHPEKKNAIIFDFSDPLVGPLDNQWKVRRSQVYQPHGYEITVVRGEDVSAYSRSLDA